MAARHRKGGRRRIAVRVSTCARRRSAAACCEKAPDTPARRPAKPMAGLADLRLARDEAARLARGRTTQKSVADVPRRRSRPHTLKSEARIVRCGKESRRFLRDGGRKNQRHAERVAITTSGDERRRRRRPDSTNETKGPRSHKRRDPRAGNTAKGRRNPMNVAGSKMTRSGPAVPGPASEGSGTPRERETAAHDLLGPA